MSFHFLALLQLDEENRSFKLGWKKDFAFTDREGNSCFICKKKLLSHYKLVIQSVTRRSQNTFSSEFPLKSELQKSKLAGLKSRVRSQQTLLSIFTEETDPTTKVSFAVSWNIVGDKSPYK
jgi:hypothetical protein